MNEEQTPPVGVAFWLLAGGSMMDRVNWVIDNGFKGISLLQTAVEIDEHERKDIAAAIVSENLYLTYHGNVHHKLTDDAKLDADFVSEMTDDIIWWQENTNGVFSCCSDAINVMNQSEVSTFDLTINAKHLKAMFANLNKYGINIGIENAFGGDGRFCSIDVMKNIQDACSDFPLGMLLDAAHANIHTQSDGVAGESTIDSYVKDIPFDILEVHFSDNFGKEDEHKGLGFGNLDLRKLFGALKSKEFNGVFTLEICKDMLSGNYALDIGNSKQIDVLLASRDRIVEEWTASK